MMWLIGLLAFFGSMLAFVLSFGPPGQIATGSNTVWYSVLVIGCIVVVAAPFVIYALRKPSWRDPQAAAEFAPFHWEAPATPAPAATPAAGAAPAAPKAAPSGPKNTHPAAPKSGKTDPKPFDNRRK